MGKSWLLPGCSELKLSRDNRVLLTLLFCLSFVGLGLCIASIGPVLLELSVQTDASLTHVGYCFAARR